MSVLPGSLLFIVEASASVGTGHLRRCSTFARHLKCLGWSIKFQILHEPAPSFPEDVLSQILLDLPWNSQKSPTIPQGSVVVLDVSASLQKEVAKACQEKAALCLALDYLQPDVLPTAVVTLKDLSGRMASAFAVAGRAHDFHEGITFAMMRPSFTTARRQIQPAGQNGLLDTLITIGGADPNGLTLEAMNLLRPWRNRLGPVTVVLGPAVAAGTIKKVTSQARALQFDTVIAPKKFDQRLAAADLVLCNGGSTLLEAMCLGRLIAVLAQTKAETQFAQTFVDLSACVWAREVGQIIEMTEQERLEFAQTAASIVDGEGLGRLTAILTDLVTSRIDAR